MRVDLNERPSCFFLFELQDFHCEIHIRIRGEREGGSNLGKEKFRIVCQYVYVEQYEARREHISSLALGGGGRGLGPLFSPFMKNLSGGKEKKRQGTTLLCHPFIFKSSMRE